MIGLKTELHIGSKDSLGDRVKLQHMCKVPELEGGCSQYGSMVHPVDRDGDRHSYSVAQVGTQLGLWEVQDKADQRTH